MYAVKKNTHLKTKRIYVKVRQEILFSMLLMRTII